MTGERNPDQLGDEALRDLFSGLARPSLSPWFQRELRQRLERERALRRSTRRWAAALRIYWLLASAAGLVIILRLPGADLGPSVSGPIQVVLLFGCLLPVAILIFVTRTDPLELALSSMEWINRAAGRRPAEPPPGYTG